MKGFVMRHMWRCAADRRYQIAAGCAAALAAAIGLAVLPPADAPTAQQESAALKQRTPAATTEAQARQRTEPTAASRGSARRSAAPASTPADPDNAPSPATEAETTQVTPVAGLDNAQMDNAQTIVRTGRDMGVSRRGLVIAVATAMQESNLYNYASGVLPESQNYPHQAVGWDHDSVGLFQQRPSTGWGAVRDLMRPEYATKQFLTALLAVPGWQKLPLTVAAQTVQVSAFPYLYAQHEWRATEVVDAFLD